MSEHEEKLEWNEDEREILRGMAAGLPGAARRAAELEESTVRRLRRQGLLAGSRTARAYRRGRWAVAAALLLALLPAVFLAGMVTGQRAAARDTAAAFAEAFDDEALAAAARVQETGSAHVTALTALGSLASGEDPARLAQGREAARAALYAAAVQLARLDPEDPLAVRLVRLLDAVEEQDDNEETEELQVVWF